MSVHQPSHADDPDQADLPSPAEDLDQAAMPSPADDEDQAVLPSPADDLDQAAIPSIPADSAQAELLFRTRISVNGSSCDKLSPPRRGGRGGRLVST